MPRRTRTNNQASSVVAEQFIFSKCAPKAIVNAFLANPTSGMIRGIIARTMGVRIPAETRTKRELDAFFIHALDDPSTPVNMPTKPYDRTCLNNHHWSNVHVPHNQQRREAPRLTIAMPNMERPTARRRFTQVEPEASAARTGDLRGINVPSTRFSPAERVIDVPVSGVSVRRTEVYDTILEGTITVTIPSAIRRYWSQIVDPHERETVQIEHVRLYARDKIVGGVGVDYGTFEVYEQNYRDSAYTARTGAAVGSSLGNSSDSIVATINMIESHNRSITERLTGETDG